MTILSSYFYEMHGLVIVSHLWWNKSKTADLWKTECHFVKLHSYLMVKFASWCTDFLKLLIKKCALFFKNNITKVEYCPVLNMYITYRSIQQVWSKKNHDAVFFYHWIFDLQLNGNSVLSAIWCSLVPLVSWVSGLRRCTCSMIHSF